MNPMQFMMNQMGNMSNMVKGQTNAKGMPIFTAPGKHEAKQQINPILFKQYIPMVNQSQWDNLIAQARQQGISEADIQAGLQMIQKMK